MPPIDGAGVSSRCAAFFGVRRWTCAVSLRCHSRQQWWSVRVVVVVGVAVIAVAMRFVVGAAEARRVWA